MLSSPACRQAGLVERVGVLRAGLFEVRAALGVHPILVDAHVVVDYDDAVV